VHVKKGGQSCPHARDVHDTSRASACRACRWRASSGKLGSRRRVDRHVPESRHFTDKTYRLVRFVERRAPSPTASSLAAHVRRLQHCAQPAASRRARRRHLSDRVRHRQHQRGRLNGCRYCVASCPFGVVAFTSRRVRRRSARSHDRTPQRLGPACAKACPTDSIQFGFRDDLVAKPASASNAQARLQGAQLYGADSGGSGRPHAFSAAREPATYNLPETPAAAAQRRRRLAAPSGRPSSSRRRDARLRGAGRGARKC